MAESNEKRGAERLDRLVSDVLAGRHLKATASDAAERESIRVAARLAGSATAIPACPRRSAGGWAACWRRARRPGG